MGLIKGKEKEKAAPVPAVKGKQEVSTEVVDFTKDMGQGFEDNTAADYAIPFLRVLQSNSPACEVRGAEQIVGAVPGHFINTVTEDVMDGEAGVLFVPCVYERVFIEWKPNRGGFARQHTAAAGEALLLECTKDEKGKDILPNGNILSDTRNWYGLIISEEEDTPPAGALLSLVSTQIKKSKKWMSKAEGLRLPGMPNQQLPLFSHIYRICTVTEANDDGTWFGVRVDLEGVVQDQSLYEAAKTFRFAIKSGAVKAQAPTQDGEGAASDAM
jgi:hypothetical protein